MKVGDKVKIVDVGTAGLQIGTKETITKVYDEGTPSEWYDVSSGWAYAGGELELINPEPKLKVGDKVKFKAGEYLYTRQNALGGGGVVRAIDGNFFLLGNGSKTAYTLRKRIELINPEPKGQCLTDATQELYTALKVLLATSIKVETHLIVHPYQRALVEAIHVAQEAIDKAENGELGEKQVECFVLHSDKLFPGRTICPVCHTNHEV